MYLTLFQMKFKVWCLFGICLCIVILFGCQQNYQKPIQIDSNDPTMDFFIHANKFIIQQEEKKIDSLLALSPISFLKDPTGIRTYINKKIDDPELSKPEDGDNVLVAYNCVIFDHVNNLADDVLVDTIGFKIGYSKQMRGLNYAIKLLKVGYKSKIIIPSYLGFGMSGYGKSVPPYSTLILNVELLNIEK